MLSAEQFDAAYRLRFKGTVRYLSARGLTREAAKEWAQAAWTRAWESREQLRSDTALHVWINSIGINLYLNGLRSSRNIAQLSEAEIRSSRVDFDTHILATELMKLTSDEDKQLFHKRFYLGYSDAEIARQYGISDLAIRIRFHRAKARLKATLSRSSCRPARLAKPVPSPPR